MFDVGSLSASSSEISFVMIFYVGALSASSSLILFVLIFFDVSALSASSSDILFLLVFLGLIALSALVPWSKPAHNHFLMSVLLVILPLRYFLHWHIWYYI